MEKYKKYEELGRKRAEKEKEEREESERKRSCFAKLLSAYVFCIAAFDFVYMVTSMTNLVTRFNGK